MIGDFLRLADGVGSDGDAAAGVGLDEVDGVVPLEEGEVVPEEGFGGRRGRWRRNDRSVVAPYGRELAVGPVGVGGGAAGGDGEGGEFVEPAVGVAAGLDMLPPLVALRL